MDAFLGFMEFFKLRNKKILFVLNKINYKNKWIDKLKNSC
jgi:hypothetical protein